MQNNRFSVAVLGAGNIGTEIITRIQELDDNVLIEKSFSERYV